MGDLDAKGGAEGVEHRTGELRSAVAGDAGGDADAAPYELDGQELTHLRGCEVDRDGEEHDGLGEGADAAEDGVEGAGGQETSDSVNDDVAPWAGGGLQGVGDGFALVGVLGGVALGARVDKLLAVFGHVVPVDVVGKDGVGTEVTWVGCSALTVDLVNDVAAELLVVGYDEAERGQGVGADVEDAVVNGVVAFDGVGVGVGDALDELLVGRVGGGRGADGVE